MSTFVQQVLLALVSCLVLSAAASAQAGGLRPEGPFVAVDVAGWPLVLGIEDRTFGATAGYRTAGGAEASLRVERAPAVEDFPINASGKTYVGAGAALALGPARTPFRFAAAAGLAVEDGSELALFPQGTAEFRGGRRVYQYHATASVLKFFRLTDGQVRLSAGVGPFVEVRRRLEQRTTFRAGEPDEVTVVDEPATDVPLGLAVAAPVSVRLSRSVDMVVETSIRLDLASTLLGGFGVPYVTVGLDF